MYAILQMFHVLGWSGWFGVSIAEAIVGAQTRRADSGAARTALAATWGRIGRVQMILMLVGVLVGDLLLAYACSLVGAGAYFKEPGNRHVHVMLLTGTLGAVFGLMGWNARGKAVEAAGGSEEGFLGPYKKAAMFGGMASLCMLLTIVAVYLKKASFY